MLLTATLHELTAQPNRSAESWDDSTRSESNDRSAPSNCWYVECICGRTRRRAGKSQGVGKLLAARR